MGTGVPLLNEYKQSFLFKRIPQTILGGLKLRLGYSAPAYVYINQVILWLIPWLLGNIFTLVLELAYTDEQILDFLLLYSCLYGACIIIFVVVVQTITTVVQMKEKENLQDSVFRKKKMNILAEEDEVDFESCCGAETLGFVIPPKKFKINIALHALLSGLVCGLGFWYLLPYSINKLYGHNYVATAIMYIIGWLTVNIAQYSLTTGAPPEPAIYRSMDVYELLPLTRPFYSLVCYTIHIANWYYDDFKLANQAVHIVFVLLPLLWLSGLLPPMEMMLLWLMEQFLVLMLGGSPTASSARLLCQVTVSCGVYLGCYFLPSNLSSVVLAATAGYLLSCDLGSLGTQIFKACSKSNKNRIATSKTAIASSTSPRPNAGFLWSWCWSTVLYHAIMTTIVGGEAAAVNYHSSSVDADVAKFLGYAIIGLCVVEKMARDFQGVFLLFGLWRNCLYPSSVESGSSFKDGKRRLLLLGMLRRVLINWVCPLVMTGYLSLKISNDDVMSKSLHSGMASTLAVFYVFGVVRAFRSVWQSTSHALLEFSIVHVVLTTMSDNSTVQDFQAPVLLLIVGVVRNRFYQFSNKLFFAFSLMLTSWTDRKQRRGSTAPTIFLNLLFFPVLLVLILTATALSAPLLPLFTLPLFFIGYPRHNRFWPEPVGQSANTCPDAVYYSQLAVQLSKGLRSAFAMGSLGEPQVGNHYLVRFQDRLAWCLVLERGAGYCTLSIKGLELQETSCHTAEAARIDEQFEEAFERNSRSRSSCLAVNHYPLHSLTPLDAVLVRTYSDARNILTGVIDSPDSVGTTLSFFAKSLVWLLLHHINKLKKVEEERKRAKEKEIAEMEQENQRLTLSSSPPPSVSAAKRLNKESFSGGGGGSKRRDKVSVVNSNSSMREINHNVAVAANPRSKESSNRVESFVLPPITGNRTNLVHNSRPPSRDSNSSRKVSLSSSLNSFTDSIWSDDFDLDRNKKRVGSTKRPPQKVSTVVTITNRSTNRPHSPHSVLTSLPPLTVTGKPDFGGFDWADGGDFLGEIDFGMPAVDINAPHRQTNVEFEEVPRNISKLGGGRTAAFDGGSKPSSRLTMSNNTNHIYKPVMNLAGSPDFKCPFSSHMSVPSKWRELPIEPSQLSRYMTQFPVSWYKHTLSTLDWSMAGHPRDKVSSEVGADDALTTCYSQLVMACCSAFDTPGRPGGANYLYKCYNGDVPWNAMIDWLSEDKELLSIVIKAFRYGFKLMLDQTLIGEISDDDELEEYLQSYDSDWYIGRETDPDWGLAVLKSRSNLFSLGHNMAQGTYTSRTLSLQELPVLIGRLNQESVTGQWANLTMELFYMTNDDEERYSIQAQPALLRNLTVQAADPPLGYPIFSSTPITVPTV